MLPSPDFNLKGGTDAPLQIAYLSRTSSSSVRGVDHKFTASIKNTGSKTINSVQWAYTFVSTNARDGVAYVFTTRASFFITKVGVGKVPVTTFA